MLLNVQLSNELSKFEFSATSDWRWYLNFLKVYGLVMTINKSLFSQHSLVFVWHILSSDKVKEEEEQEETVGMMVGWKTMWMKTNKTKSHNANETPKKREKRHTLAQSHRRSHRQTQSRFIGEPSNRNRTREPSSTPVVVKDAKSWSFSCHNSFLLCLSPIKFNSVHFMVFLFGHILPTNKLVICTLSDT